MEENNILDNCLITGGNGMIGKNINFGFKPSSIEMDVTNKKSIENYISIANNISCIIHLAAINIRESEDNPNKSINVNVNGTIEMLKIARQLDIPFVHVSTGAVFSSTNQNERFYEDSIQNPNCMYGYTKSSSEKVSLLYKKTILIRTGWLFGGHQKNHYKFVENTINNLLANTIVNASNNFIGSPTYVNDFIDKMKYLIINSKYGIHHVVNSGIGSGYDIALEISSHLNVSTTLINSVASNEIPNAGPMRSNTEILESIHNYNMMRHWKESLKEYIGFYLVKRNIVTQNKIEENHPKKWSNRTVCRLCNSNNLYTFFNLEHTPPANHFLTKPEHQEYIPLDICICKKCNHIQLIQIVCPEYQYSNYLYVSSTSKTMTQHLQNSVIEFTELLNLDKNDNILEIGANDGVCVSYLLNNGFKNIVGVDPAKNINSYHTLPIICDFFGSNIIPKMQDKLGTYKLIYAFHCCAHIENIQDIFETIYQLLDNNGSFIMEVGYFYEVFKNNLFDVIYHEHIDYHTTTAIRTFGLKHKLLLYKVRENNIQGGSIQFFFTKNIEHHDVDDSVNDAIEKETQINLFNIDNLNCWKNLIIQNGKDINYIVNGLIRNGKIIAGYGAPAKLTTFMHQYKLSKSTIKCIIDDNSLKHNLYTPGLHIPIKPITIFQTEHIDYIIIFSWNFSDEIVKKLEVYRKNGIRIIIPFPEIKII